MSFELKRKAMQLHNAEFDCEHSFTEVRRRTIKGGAFQFTHQCLRCGESVGNPIAKAVACANGDVRDWDVALQEDYERRRRESAEEASRAGDKEFWDNYSRYLKSDEWRKKRELVLTRDRYICQGCLTRTATQVHHLTYEHVGRELLFELVSICDPCHEVAHSDKGKS